MELNANLANKSSMGRQIIDLMVVVNRKLACGHEELSFSLSLTMGVIKNRLGQANAEFFYLSFGSPATKKSTRN